MRHRANTKKQQRRLEARNEGPAEPVGRRSMVRFGLVQPWRWLAVWNPSASSTFIVGIVLHRRTRCGEVFATIAPLMALRAAPAPTSNKPSLQGRVILIVQRSWLIARNLASAFEAKGARVLSTNNTRSAAEFVDEPGLSAAIVDSARRAICKKLSQRDIPFVVYTGRERIDDECADGPTIRKPASAEVIVATVKRLLSSKRRHLAE
jgi:hypothetical protein